MGQASSCKEVEGCCKENFSACRESGTVKVDTSLLMQESTRRCSKENTHGRLDVLAPPEPDATSRELAQQLTQFNLPDHNTPVLTGLLVATATQTAGGRPEVDVAGEVKPLPAGISLACGAHVFKSDSEAANCAVQDPGTPSTSIGSPSTNNLGSPAMSLCPSSQYAVSPAGADTCELQEVQNDRMRKAQSLLAGMLIPSRQSSANAAKDRAKRRCSEPPSPAVPKLSASGAAGLAANGQATAPTRPSRRCSPCEPEVVVQDESSLTPGLQPLNGRMPFFPPAELNSREQVGANRRKRVPEVAREAG